MTPPYEYAVWKQHDKSQFMNLGGMLDKRFSNVLEYSYSNKVEQGGILWKRLRFSKVNTGSV